MELNREEVLKAEKTVKRVLIEKGIFDQETKLACLAGYFQTSVKEIISILYN